MRGKSTLQQSQFVSGTPMKRPKPPKALDAITDLVLAYRPKPKSKPAKKRKRRAAKARKDNKA